MARDVNKFMQYIIDTNGNPTSQMAKECDLEGFFCELCMRNPTAENLVAIAKAYLRKEENANG